MSGKKFVPNVGGGLPSLGARALNPTVLPGMTGGLGTPAPKLASKPKPENAVRHARSLNGKPIGLVPDFISESERALLHDYVKQADAPWETNLAADDVWHGRLINPRSMSPKVLRLMEKIRKRTVAHIKADYDIADSVYADTLQLVRWRPGDNQKAHADCEEPNGQPNATPWRAFASIIYLNDEYTGGGIYFPDRKLRPQIKPRTLAYFPSTNQYRHGVEAISSGLRYTMSCFYTFDARRHDGYPV